MHRIFRTVTLTVLPIALFACSPFALEDSLAVDERDSDYDEEPDDNNLEDDQDGDGLTEEPLFWSIDGALTIEEGVLSLDHSTLTIGYWGEKSLLCEERPRFHAQPSSNVSPDILPVGWWLVELHIPEAPPCYVDLPRTSFYLGLGPQDPLLAPAMDANGFDSETTSTYGMYIRFDDSIEAPTYIFGLAGTEDNLAGIADPVDQAPLPDGTYHLVTLHLLPLEL